MIQIVKKTLDVQIDDPVHAKAARARRLDTWWRPYHAKLQAELARLRKQIDKLEKDLDRARGKLANPKFIDRAPAEIVAKEQARVGELEASLGNLKEQEQQIGRL